MANVNVALHVQIEARPGKEEEVAAFLRDGLAVVQDESGTVAWFAVRVSPSTFAIFDAFPDGDARQDHLGGRLGSALMERADELFARPPSIEQLDVLAHKLP
ncbi:putative quinol monooxygenase [Streptomyces apricus]|uniref:Antibiotic biosynthesis monooxygenase n=1 Tax=Streptomyces apricus TaxID=1828112 RepID=A0A5B0BJ59_9ACTN|nr:antibiotic biosynthesis monooxygenase [Streptomyces apricus]KAA0941282.1 antibiotic biosynthesis monooxygenase [Streptomyces apricus]